MIHAVRTAFNAQYSTKRYQKYLEILNADFKDSIPFRIAETPVFIDKAFKNKMLEAGEYICDFITDPSFPSKTNKSIPSDLHIPNEQPYPNCLVVDFAIAKGPDGELVPQLIELQGFPSLFAFEVLQAKALESAYIIPQGFSPFLNGYDSKSYLRFLTDIIKGDPPKQTILLEIKPYEQKTRLDLLLTEAWLDIPIVCLSEIYAKGNVLYYKKAEKEIKIERIYNRVVYDELMQQNAFLIAKFNLFQNIEGIEWVNHPHHFFRISKYILPLLKHLSVPESSLLKDWNEHDCLPNNSLDKFVCKPLFSFGGQGVMLNPTIEKLVEIKDSENWILQRKVDYAPVIETPSGPSKAEIRLFYFWDNQLKRYIATNNLTRISKGPMIGVGYNDTATWIGGSISYFEQ